jgi:hypothetical protein
MSVIVTTQASAQFLVSTLLTDASERAAELQRDTSTFYDDITKPYIIQQEQAVRDLRVKAMSVQDMIDVGVYDEKEIIRIRAFFPDVAAKSKFGV